MPFNLQGRDNAIQRRLNPDPRKKVMPQQAHSPFRLPQHEHPVHDQLNRDQPHMLPFQASSGNGLKTGHEGMQYSEPRPMMQMPQKPANFQPPGYDWRKLIPAMRNRFARPVPLQNEMQADNPMSWLQELLESLRGGGRNGF